MFQLVDNSSECLVQPTPDRIVNRFVSSEAISHVVLSPVSLNTLTYELTTVHPGRNHRGTGGTCPPNFWNLQDGPPQKLASHLGRAACKNGHTAHTGMS